MWNTIVLMTPGYPIVLETEPDGGYSIECPSLPGCFSQGDTLDEALANIDEAIQLARADGIALRQE